MLARVVSTHGDCEAIYSLLISIWLRQSSQENVLCLVNPATLRNVTFFIFSNIAAVR